MYNSYQKPEAAIWNRKRMGLQWMLLAGLLVLLIIVPGCRKIKILPDPLAAGWKNQPVCELIRDNPDLRLLKCTFPPGTGHERHHHNAHTGYVIAGSRFRITDTTGTREVDVLSGTSFSSDGIPWHEVLNIGDSTAVILIMEPK